MKLVTLVFLTLFIQYSVAITISEESLKKVINSLGYVGIFLSSLVFSLSLFLPIPLYIPMIAIAIAKDFNPIATILLASIGSSIGEITSYLIGLGAYTKLEKFKSIKKFRKLFDKYGSVIIIILSFLPFADIAGILAGSSKYEFKKFFIFTFVGKLLKMYLIFYSLYFGIDILLSKWI
ncbi:MAG: VTT domain-containing protein [Candidatus Aenigmatarchaeota archaeon]